MANMYVLTESQSLLLLCTCYHYALGVVHIVGHYATIPFHSRPH